ncbi:unnamed protein product [Somion occarium]|uniref:F-box domain-containing protein n=2 Tax=Somion occarium TaxID=3059160 RepID=A0ABP1D972_9APHY
MESISAMSLRVLPAELICSILDELPVRELVGVMQVCRLFRDTIKSSTGLMYKIELMLATMEDVSLNITNKAAKRELLQRYRKAWSASPWKASSRKVVRLMDGPLWELCGGIFVQSTGRRELTFTQLPSQIRGMTEREWKVKVPFDIADFCIDPSLNLIAAIEDKNGHGRLHLLTMFSGEKHICAEKSVVKLPLPPVGNTSYNIRISGELVAILTRTWSFGSTQWVTKFVVFHWTLAKQKLSKTELGDDLNLFSFAFLDGRHIAVAHGDRTIPQGELVAALTIIDISSRIREDQRVARKVTLYFPSFKSGWSLENIEVACDPAPCYSASPMFNPPFQVARLERIVSVKLFSVDPQWESEDAQQVLVPAHTLISLVRSGESTSNGGVPWHEWGPRKTRMLRAAALPNLAWCYPVYGTKCVGREQGKVVIYDFNQLAVRFAAGSPPDSQSGEIILHSDTEEPEMFAGTITTSLPYRKFTSEVPIKRDDSVMINEDSIVVVKETNDTFIVYSL